MTEVIITPIAATPQAAISGAAMIVGTAPPKVGRSLVYAVLAGRKKCYRGDSHKVAVLLGLKDGVIVESRSQ